MRVALLIHNNWSGDFGLLTSFLNRFSDNFVAVTPVPPLPGSPSFEKILKKNWRSVPLTTLARLAWLVSRQSLEKIAGAPSDMLEYFRKLPGYADKIIPAVSINDPGYVGRLRGLVPDIIVSYACHQIFKRDLLRVPELGCINVHPGRLPAYKGPSPLFYTLLRGEKTGAVSVHELVEGVDDGQVIEQQSFAVDPEKDSLRVMAAERVPPIALSLLEKALLRIAAGEVPLGRPGVRRQGEYQSWPGPAEISEFFKSGRRLV